MLWRPAKVKEERLYGGPTQRLLLEPRMKGTIKSIHFFWDQKLYTWVFKKHVGPWMGWLSGVSHRKDLSIFLKFKATAKRRCQSLYNSSLSSSWCGSYCSGGGAAWVVDRIRVIFGLGDQSPTGDGQSDCRVESQWCVLEMHVTHV